MYGTAVYSIWRGIKSRCNDKTNPHYGKRGITVCARWKDSFENFYKDMGDRPSNKHSIDREDNDAGYSPTNCRWVTLDVQANNKSTNLPITYNGVTMNLGQWAKKLNIHRKTLQWRSLHWPTDRCCTPKIP